MPAQWSRRALLRSSLGAGAGLGALAACGRSAAAGPPEQTLAEARSQYNHVRVGERGSVRTMYFVGDNGMQYIESRTDRAYPQSLDLDYTRTMMAGFLLHPQPKRLLMLGLGGGGMSNYLHARIPGLEIDAVEIDPEVVRLAQTYFEQGKWQVERSKISMHLPLDTQKTNVLLLAQRYFYNRFSAIKPLFTAHIDLIDHIDYIFFYSSIHEHLNLTTHA